MTRKKKLWCRVADFGNLVAIFSPSEEIEEEAGRSRRRWKWWWGVYAVHQYTSCTLILFDSFYNLLIELQHLMPSFFLPLTMFVWNCWNMFRVVTSIIESCDINCGKIAALQLTASSPFSHHHQSTWICATLNILRWEKDTCCLYPSFWDKKKTHFCLESKTIHIMFLSVRVTWTDSSTNHPFHYTLGIQLTLVIPNFNDNWSQNVMWWLSSSLLL